MAISVRARTATLAAALFMVAPAAGQESTPADTLVIKVFVAATDTTDASDTTTVRIPVTVVAATRPTFALPAELDTVRAGDVVSLPLRDYLTDGDAPVASLSLTGTYPPGSMVRNDSLVWVVTDTSRGTQAFQVVALDTLGNSGSGTYRVFVRYQPPAPVLRFTQGYAEGDTLRLVAGRPDSLTIELENVDSRDRPLIRVERDPGSVSGFVTADTVSGADPPAIKIRFAPSEDDATSGPQSLFLEYDAEQGLLVFF